MKVISERVFVTGMDGDASPFDEFLARARRRIAESHAAKGTCDDFTASAAIGATSASTDQFSIETGESSRCSLTPSTAAKRRGRTSTASESSAFEQAWTRHHERATAGSSGVSEASTTDKFPLPPRAHWGTRHSQRASSPPCTTRPRSVRSPTPRQASTSPTRRLATGDGHSLPRRRSPNAGLSATSASRRNSFGSRAALTPHPQCR